MADYGLDILGVEDCTTNVANTMHMKAYPVRTKRSRSSTAPKAESEHDVIHNVPANGRGPNQMSGLQRQRNCGILLHATRSRQRREKAPEWSICRNPSLGFSDAPLAYIAGQLPGPSQEDLHAYHQQLIDSSTQCYAAAAYRWVDLLWNVARSHEILFHSIVVFARYKEANCACMKTFLDSKNRILRLISTRVQNPGDGTHHDGRTLVAIALLAYTDLRDGDFEAAETHLRALPLLSAADSWSPYEWVYIAWIDLRLALLRNQRPTLSYYIPPAFREPPFSMARQSARARKLALSNIKHGPRNGADQTFTNVCFHMFSSLHEIGLAWHALNQAGEIPFGALYGLEYSLRTMQDGVRTSEGSDHSSEVNELILLCIQLQTWILGRFWTPQRMETYIIVLRRAQSLLDGLAALPSTEEEIPPNDDWQGLTEVLDPTCILWITFTLAGIAIEFGHPCQAFSATATPCTNLKMMKHSEIGPILMIDGKIFFKKRKEAQNEAGRNEDSAQPWASRRPKGKQRKKSAPGTGLSVSGKQELPKENGKPDERQLGTITVKLPRDALNDLLKNGPDKASASSLRDIATAIHQEDAPLRVPTEAVRTFKIALFFCGPGVFKTRALFACNQNTLYDLAVVAEDVFGVALKDQEISTTFGNDMEVKCYPREPYKLGTLQEMGGLEEGLVFWVEDGRYKIPKALFEEVFAQRPTSGASKKRKAPGELDDDNDDKTYRSSSSASNNQKRKKPNTNGGTTTVIIDLPTKALDDILNNVPSKAPQKSIREIIAMIHSQKALITSHSKPADFTITTCRNQTTWKNHFRVNNVHKLHDLARAIAAASGTGIQSMLIDVVAVGREDVVQQYCVANVEDAGRTIEELGLVQGSRILFKANDKKQKDEGD
ncbi:hypothetical protein M409DRAFT_61427 [Zasmidium cellare ATCC 36951]|uniref:Uncharacterized protein n=1 Tax=Zasmidium cellare ATCC 36951 TaxID=1080233 RepID=A0A6A6BYW2_ZASCE|nr:uncharacterized protein M409DRAFT_61427 [Zasmidium cellare ATCC 36951]KAF2158709.1 hypothetical protein M409DRAFT_61427 [Zasmidium cellare ATCC 36951]